MENSEAIKILHSHNLWRRGITTKLEDPKEIGKAIELAIRALKKIEETKKL